MSDQEEIRDLIARYAHAADDGKGSDYADLYTPDGVIETHGKQAVGRDQLVALIDGIYDYSIKHMQMNTSIQLDRDDPDRATAQTDLLMLAMDPQSTWQISGCARYDDELVRQDGKWRFRRRVCNWHRNTPQEVLVGLEQLLTGAPVG